MRVLLIALLLTLAPGRLPAQQPELARAAEQARRAWNAHDAKALVAESPRLLVQLPGSDPSVALGPEQAAALLSDYMVQGGVTYRILTDQLGSPRIVTNTSNGAVVYEMDYDEYGRVTRETGTVPIPFGFAGGLYDRDTKLVRFGARDYDPETGRFTAKDPLSFEGGDTNLYGYALGDPVNVTDSTGMILDTLVDIGFIAYDLYKIGSSLANGCGVSGTDLLALGADVAGALIPFATGGGAAVRAGRTAMNAADAGRGGAAAVRTGQAGEAAVRAANNIGPLTKTPISINGRTRIPDGLTPTTLSEVKNVASQSYTQQLRDFAAYAQQSGRTFDLYVRPNTRLSGPLQDAIRNGTINLKFIP